MGRVFRGRALYLPQAQGGLTRVAVITPVGPGHKQVSQDCVATVKAAWTISPGPFTSIQHELIDDTTGRLGRSRARNTGMDVNREADWFFFIDADDLAQPLAFQWFGEAINRQPELDAVFGSVCTDRNGVIEENLYPLTWDTLVHRGAVGTLSMGCFIRCDVARETRFDESMDAAEDFDFYLRLLRDRCWTKIKQPLVTIRTKIPSAIGPRGYTSLKWREACQVVVDRWKV